MQKQLSPTLKIKKILNVNVKEFRPKRSAATAVEQRIRDIANNENK